MTSAAAFKKRYPTPPNNRDSVQALVQELIDFVGRRNLLASSPAYRQGDWLNKVTEAATLHLEASCRTAKDWFDALDMYEGVHAVPLMTIHKSKGLEYHTVILWVWTMAHGGVSLTTHRKLLPDFLLLLPAPSSVSYSHTALHAALAQKSPRCTTF